MNLPSAVRSRTRSNRRAAIATGWSLCAIGALLGSLLGTTDAGFSSSAGPSNNTFQAAPAFGSAPAAPSGLVASTVSQSRIDISWSDTSSDESGFEVERSPGGQGTWAIVATVGEGTTTYDNTGLSPDTTYDFRVRAFNSYGTSAYSNVASATTLTSSSTPTVPSGPADLSGSALSPTEISLVWTDTASAEDGFRVERSPAGAGSWAAVASLGADATGHTDTGLSASTAYDYRVFAYNGAGDSTPSNTVSVSTADVCASPGVVTALSEADAYVSEASPSLTRGTSPLSFVTSSDAGDRRTLVRFPLPVVPDGCGVSSSTLRLHNVLGTSGRTLETHRAGSSWGETTVHWSNQPARLGVPVPAITSAAGWLDWDVADHVQAMYAGTNTGFVVQDAAEGDLTQPDQWLITREARAELTVTFGGGSCTAPGQETVAPDADTYVDQDAPTTNPNATDPHALRIHSQNAKRNRRALVRYPLPAIPAGCTITDAVLELNAYAPDAGRTIEAHQAAAPWSESTVTWDTQPAMTGPPASTASAERVQFSVATQVAAMYAGTNNGFVLKDSAENASGSFSQLYASREAMALRPQLVLTLADANLPATPSGLTAEAQSSSSISLSWSDHSSNEQGFRIERSPSGVATWTQIATVGPDVTGFTDTGLSPDTTWDYRIRAYNADGTSAYSNTATASTLP